MLDFNQSEMKRISFLERLETKSLADVFALLFHRDILVRISLNTSFISIKL